MPTTLASDGVSSTSCYTHLIVTTQPPTLKTVNSVSPFLNYFFVSKISTIKSSVAARLSGFHPSAKFPNSIVSGFSVDFIPSVTSDEVLKLLSIVVRISPLLWTLSPPVSSSPVVQHFRN